jgi:REP element-mobilizing transposase RayT
MPQARCRLVSTEVTPFYHVTARCVRRHFLCGLDPLTGKDYSARKQAIQDRLALLADVFAIDVCAYAILSNHYHLVVHIDQQKSLDWSDLDVAQRWIRLFTGPALVRAFVAGQTLSDGQQRVVSKHVSEYRARLSDLSWFMKCLNESIARQANAEDNVTGHFWQARFASQALLDEAAVLMVMAYVDLNPVRAGMAETPETSDYTSIQQRIAAWQAQQQKTELETQSSDSGDGTSRLENSIVDLLGFRGDGPHAGESAIPCCTADYLELVDWTGRAIAAGKKGAIPPNLPPILGRLRMEPEQYISRIRKPGLGLTNALGALDKLKEYAAHFGKAFLKGQTAAAALFSPG